MTGDYVSDEAETEFNVALTPKGLEIHQRPDIIYPLTPAYAGGFDSKLGSVRFLRDTSGRITELSLGDSPCGIFVSGVWKQSRIAARREDQQAKKPQSTCAPRDLH
jgi:hypothetical protein